MPHNANEIDPFDLEDTVSSTLGSSQPKLLLNNSNLGDKGALVIAKAILSTKCKLTDALICSLTNNNIWAKGIKELAPIISSGKLLKGSQLDFSNNVIGRTGLKAIIKALMAKGCPQELTLALSNCNLDDKDALEILTFFVSGHCPLKTRIIFTQNNNISAAMEKRLKEACNPLGLQAATIIFGTEQTLQNPSPQALALEYLRSKPIAKAITLNLSETGLQDMEAICIAECINQLERPLDADALTLNLKRNGIGDAGAIALANILSSGKLPPCISLQLSFNDISKDAASVFIKTLDSVTSPYLIILDLTANPKIPPAFGNQLSQALRRKNIYFYFLQALALYQREFGSILLPLAKIILDYVVETLDIDSPENNRLTSLRIANAWQFSLKNNHLTKLGLLAPKTISAAPSLSHTTEAPSSCVILAKLM